MLPYCIPFRLQAFILFFAFLFGSSALLRGQNNEPEIGRGGETFPYPFSHFSFIQPRFDRQNLLYGDYINSYVIRGTTTFDGSNHLRIELPMANTNTSGENIFGLSDIKVRLLHATPISGRWYIGYGAEMTLPSATDASLGSGKWQARPELGTIYFFGQPRHPNGSFILAMDYRFDFAGQSNRKHISVLGFVPNFDYWAKKWYLGYYATWTYDFINHIWDIPIDVEYGYTILPKTTLAAEFILPLVKKRTYNNEFAIKLRYAF